MEDGGCRPLRRVETCVRAPHHIRAGALKVTDHACCCNQGNRTDPECAEVALSVGLGLRVSGIAHGNELPPNAKGFGGVVSAPRVRGAQVRQPVLAANCDTALLAAHLTKRCKLLAPRDSCHRLASQILSPAASCEQELCSTGAMRKGPRKATKGQHPDSRNALVLLDVWY